ncbi:hypothetical protein ACJX0J_020544, partial [Zea mays]
MLLLRTQICKHILYMHACVLAFSLLIMVKFYARLIIDHCVLESTFFICLVFVRYMEERGNLTFVILERSKMICFPKIETTFSYRSICGFENIYPFFQRTLQKEFI